MQQHQANNFKSLVATASVPNRRPTSLSLIANNAFINTAKFAEHTTMHGIDHLFRSSNSLRRYFWLLITVLASFAGSYHMYLTMTQFFTTPVNTQILNQAVPTVFPDVTICNLKPIPHYILYHNTSIRTELLKTFQYTQDVLEQQFKKIFPPQGPSEMFGETKYYFLYQLLLTIWTSLPTRDIGNQLDHSMAACSYKRKSCKQAGKFTLIQNSHFWNCWLYQPSDRSIQGTGPEDGLNFFFYTGTTSKHKHPSTDIHFPPLNSRHDILDKLNFIFGKLATRTSTGLRVLVHEPNTYPHIYWDGFDVGNGHRMDIHFSMTDNKYISRTGQLCVQNYGNITYFTGEDTKQTYNISRPLSRTILNTKTFVKKSLDCVVELWQKILKKECNCVSTHLPSSSREDYCHHIILDPLITNNVNYTKEKLAELSCFNKNERRIFKTLYNDFVSTCSNVQPCEQQEYTSFSATTPWPSTTDMESFISEFVVKMLGKKVAFGHKILDDVIDDNGNWSTWNTTAHLVLENFVKVNIYADDSKSKLIRETESYSFVEVMSELGGIAGLWAGVSLLTIFEFIEFFVAITAQLCQGFALLRRQKEQDTMERDNHITNNSVIDNHHIANKYYECDLDDNPFAQELAPMLTENNCSNFPNDSHWENQNANAAPLAEITSSDLGSTILVTYTGKEFQDDHLQHVSVV